MAHVREVASRKKVCRWGRRAVDEIATVDAETEDSQNAETHQDGEMEVARWGELQYHIDMDMLAAQLPLHAFYKLRAVCKKWHALPWNRPFLEQHSTTSLPKPYFIFHGGQGCHQAILVKDATLEKWVLKPLPSFAFHHLHTSVAHGLVHTETMDRDGATLRGTVFNLHTKVFRRLPTLMIEGGHNLSKLAVENHSGSYKVLVAVGTRRVWVFDSVTGVWKQRAVSPGNFGDWEVDATSCEGVMYFKWRGWSVLEAGIPRHRPPKMFAYNFKEDVWTVLPMTPFVLPNTNQKWRDGSVRGLGEWRGALRDVSFDVAENVLRVWEFEQNAQEWLEVDRMPGSVLKWFLDRRGSRFSTLERIITASYCEQYVLMWNQGFPATSGLVRVVLYDMALRVWETLNVEKSWTCVCS